METTLLSDAAQAASCLRGIREKVDRALLPGGHIDDEVALTLTKSECCMILAVVDEFFVPRPSLYLDD